MKLLNLKEWVNSLPEEELEKRLGYFSEDYYLSGFVDKITTAEEDLYYMGDDPAYLFTKQELIDEDLDIDPSNIEIHKGDYLITF